MMESLIRHNQNKGNTSAHRSWIHTLNALTILIIMFSSTGSRRIRFICGTKYLKNIPRSNLKVRRRSSKSTANSSQVCMQSNTKTWNTDNMPILCQSELDFHCNKRSFCFQVLSKAEPSLTFALRS